jgi:DNA-binding winged helix-turn-helix (wHTH) protein
LTFNDEEPIKLSPKENELLKMLILHENDLMPRELALTKIWRDDNYFTSRSMDVYIAKLRKYLKLDDNVEILNIHGEGFRLVVKNKVEKIKKSSEKSELFRFSLFVQQRLIYNLLFNGIQNDFNLDS